MVSKGSRSQPKPEEGLLEWRETSRQRCLLAGAGWLTLVCAAAQSGFLLSQPRCSTIISLMQPDPDHELDHEIELLRRVAEGDRRSFEELYDRFANVLFSTAYRVLNNQEA